MKIYIVKAPQGEYEDYREPIVRVFADKGKAEEYIKIENAKLPLEQADKCEECLWKWKMAFEHNDEKPKCFNPDKYKTCQNYFKYSGISPLFMEEYEVDNTQSLKQQERTEVVDEIKEKFNDTIKHHFCPNPSSVDFITLCISEVEEFLDQVKGESNAKD